MRSRRVADGRVVWEPPTHCPNGHRLKPGTVLIGSDVAKHWVLCRVCGLEIQIRHDTGAVTGAQGADASTPG